MGERICSVDDCGPTSGRLKRGLCSKHYQRLAKYGSTHRPVPQYALCDGPECSRRAGTSGLCRSHYKQRSLGKPLAPLLVAAKDLGRPTYCVFPDCGRRHKARGFCKAHNDQVKRGRDLRAVQPRNPGAICARNQCEKPVVARGQCSRHIVEFYDATRRYGLTIEQYESMVREQGGACAICGGTNANGYRLSIDHDHACCPGNSSCGGCVRALLCASCNFILGHTADRPTVLRAAAEYLDNYTSRAERLAT